MNTKRPAYWIAEGAMIAAIYVVITVALAPISYGEIQVRVSEALCVLPAFTPAAIPGLFVGCLIANILGGAVIWDIIFGSFATLIGAVGAYLLRKRPWLVPIPTIVSNAIIIPFVLKYAYGVELPLPLLILSIFVGEFLSCYVLGMILTVVFKKYQHVLFHTQPDGQK